MLVLTRKPQEKIQIGDNITITIIKTKGKAVRIGIEAPADISVLRGELLAAERSASECPVTNGSVTDGSVADGSVADGGSSELIEASTEGPSEDLSEVRYSRAPRSRVTTLLPDLLGDAGPLRDMLIRRGEAVI